ncbi:MULTISPECIES: hypothetical protein [Streptomyces]|uniref:Secreted protein n=3 Tax=Streptomyces griseoaurantiacus TaxID=68213 RepID=F3NLB8_9ACTN|nr:MULTISPECIES: hypothetical protein [Streptomyces]NJP71238.1 hypothetical protein [Streptomyces sp. C1-2]EGG45844.1 hypothetical protein SGM_3932 [Streptomyces griseoaurantiacus M045]MBA5221411.1 hypothetical protein [Streptomyces griseoaurantiacus]MCF0088934.1 hypothetical protein [Streptomyces sp. MH192]MCF0098675.1 hypothetical protein [Streptomyces sp. MH191]
MIPAPRPVLYAALAALVALLPTAGPVLAQPSAAARFTRLAGDVREADGHLYDARDDTGRTMDAAQIVQPPSGPYLAVYHTALEDGRFHAAVATSTDLRTWHRRHDFGPGTSQPSLAATEDSGGDWVLAYEKDPDNHLELRSYPGLTALLTGRPERSFDAPRTLSRCAEGTPDITAARGGTVELTGHYRDRCDTDRQLTAVLHGFRAWRTHPDQRLDHAVRACGPRGNIGDRTSLRLAGHDLVLIEGQLRPDDFGSWRLYGYDPRLGRAEPVAVRTHRGSHALANPSATTITAPDGRRALLVSVFVPREGAAAGEAGELLYWRNL